MSGLDNTKLLQSIDEKLDVMLRLIAVNAARVLKEVKQIKVLRYAWWTSEEIGRFMGISALAVRLRMLHDAKKRAKIRKQKATNTKGDPSSISNERTVQ